MAVPAELAPARERPVVVVVEDDPSYLQALVRTLQRETPNVDLVTAATGVDALLEIGRVAPDLVMLDYRLPDLNAVQVVERLLDTSKRLTCAVMVVTAGMPAQAETELRRVGVGNIVNKADGMAVIVEAMQQALRARKVA